MALLAAIVSGLASGIFLRSFFILGLPVILFVFLISLLCIVAAFHTPRRYYALGALFFVCTALGMIRFGYAETALPETFAREVGHRVSYEGVVVVDPDVRDSHQRVTVRVKEDDASTLVLAVAKRYPEVGVGDRVRVSGTLALPKPFASEEEGGRIFRYAKYLEKSGVRFLLNFASIHVEAKASWWSVSAAFARVKHTFLGGLSSALPEPYASLAGGIVIGGKQGLGSELLDAFVLSGLVQIIVLSGYNVMIVAEWVMRGLAHFKLRRGANAAAGAAALTLFVLIAGAGSASIRAALMALIALYARATGRSYAATRALLAVILLMLLWNPLLLAFDPGFDLSVLATAGIIWLTPLIELRLARIKSAFWRNGVATTLAAQIAVLPFLLYQTGTLSLVAIPANLLALPVIPLTMGLSALAGIAGMIFGSFALPFALPAYVLNAYLVFLARFSAGLPFAAFHLPAFSFWVTAVMYAILTAVTVRAYRK